MFWLFASVVLILTVYHNGFRKFALWSAAAIGAVIVLMIFGDYLGARQSRVAEMIANAERDARYMRSPDKIKYCRSPASSADTDDEFGKALAKRACDGVGRPADEMEAVIAKTYPELEREQVHQIVVTSVGAAIQ